MPRFASALDAAQVASPATPGANRALIYAKSDGRWYTKGPDGVEVGPLGAAGGSANAITTNTTQTGLTGDKTSSGIWTAAALSAAGLTGATAPSRYAGAFAGTGPPTAGTFALGDFVLSYNTSTGEIAFWVCVAAGAPGSWTLVGQNVLARLAGSNSFDADMTFGGIATLRQVFFQSYSLYFDVPNWFVEPAFNNITGPGQWQPSRTLSWKTRYWTGTTAQSDNVNLSAARGSDVVGDLWLQSSTGFKGQWVGGDLAGNLGRYVGRTASVAPTAGTWQVGDFVNTTDGKFFTCTVAGTPGTWVQVGGGSTQNPITQLEQNLGGPARSGHFTISDASFLAGQQLYVQQSADALTGKGTRTDENDMDFIEVRGAVTAAGTATVYWSSRTYVKGNFKFNYRSS